MTGLKVLALTTKGGQSIIVGTQAQEQEKRHKPYANRKERSDIHEHWTLVISAIGIVSVSRPSVSFRFVSSGGEMKEPGEMVRYDESA